MNTFITIAEGVRHSWKGISKQERKAKVYVQLELEKLFVPRRD